MSLRPQNPPAGPFRRAAWRSPLRGPWLTSVLGAALLVGIPIVFVTGLLSYVAYAPALGNNRLRRRGRLASRAQTGADWRLQLAGGTRLLELSRAELLALPQQSYELPIACVEGWSTTQSWSGVRLRDLAALAGAVGFDELLVESLQEGGSFRRATLSPGQVGDRRSLLALRVNGADLSPDHGFPARIVVPALPGVHCTKWVARLEFKGTRA